MNPTRINLQDITDDADTPHVRAETNSVKVYHLGRHKLWCTEQDLHLLVGVEFAGKTKVDYLDAITRSGQAKDVFGLQIQVHNVIRVDKLKSLAYLPHKYDAGTFGQDEVVTNDAVEKFSTFDSKRGWNKVWEVILGKRKGGRESANII